MRSPVGSRRAANEQVAEVARRRLELLSAELAGIRASIPGDAVHHGAETAGPTPTGANPRADRLADPTGAVASEAGAGVGRHAHRSLGAADRAGGWVHDRLPPAMQGRVGLTSVHVSVVALLVAGAMAMAAWWVLRTDGREAVVPTVAQASPAATSLVELSGEPSEEVAGPAPAGVPTAPSSSTGGRIIIDVAGKVRRPGIARLPAGSRVADALRSAGGPRKGVNLTSLNLARVLVDGEQILVGVPAPTGVAPPAASAPTASASGLPVGLVNINTADQIELETLPGIGPVTAQAILTWRTDNGAFGSVDELLEVSGIGDATLAEMAPYVTI